jgi:uncharacterized protein YidB (DUF937 family)
MWLEQATLFSKNQETKMARGYPSMTALLGLLAVAGFQNRDKIAEMLRGGQQKTPAMGGQIAQTSEQDSTASPLDRLMHGIGGLFGTGAAASTGLVGGGLSELIGRFTEAGKGNVAQSWVKDGPNAAISPKELESAIGADTLETLTQQTGLDRQEILRRLARDLPDAVDRYTPDGVLPATAAAA